MLHLNYSPTQSEVKYIASHLRQQEVDELEVFLASPAKAILQSVNMSKTTATILTEKDEPIAVCGVVPLENDEGMLWVMSTDEVKKNSLGFFRVIKTLAEEQCGLYSRVVTYVDAKSSAHANFNLALGFTLTSEVLTNKELGMEYLVFEMITTKGLNDLYYKN